MKKMPICIDLAFCLIVLPMMMAIFPIERWWTNFQWYVLTVGIWLYALYFLNRRVTVPWLFGSARRRVGAVWMIAVSAGVTYALSQVNLYSPKPNVHDQGIVRVLPAVLQYQQAVLSLFMIVEAFSFAIGLLTEANLQRSRRTEAEVARDRAEIELYKARIKPHFMFNTLNSLYGLFLTGDPKALESLEMYISMLRYVQLISHRNLVPLGDEAAYIRRYVGLQKLRLNEMTHVELDIDIADDGRQVPPMLLVTFVENCFKHGISPVEESGIAIRLAEKDGRLEFSTTNRIFPSSRKGEHLGIDNCRKRLELLFGGRYELRIGSEGEFFNVHLNLDLRL